MSKYIICISVLLCFVWSDEKETLKDLEHQFQEFMKNIQKSNESGSDWKKKIKKYTEEFQNKHRDTLNRIIQEKIENKIRRLNIEEEEEIEENDKNEHSSSEARKLKIFLQEHLPEMLDILKKLRDENEEEFEETMEGLYDDMEELTELKEENPKMFTVAIHIHRLTLQSERLASQYREEKVKKHREELKDILKQVFDLKIEMNRQEVNALKEELREVSASLEKKISNKEKIIQRRLEEMTEEEDFDW